MLLSNALSHLSAVMEEVYSRMSQERSGCTEYSQQENISVFFVTQEGLDGLSKVRIHRQIHSRGN